MVASYCCSRAGSGEGSVQSLQGSGERIQQMSGISDVKSVLVVTDERSATSRPSRLWLWPRARRLLSRSPTD